MTPEPPEESGNGRILLPPHVSTTPPRPEERRSWTLDALDALADARGERLRDRGDSPWGSVYMGVVGVVMFTAMAGSVASSVFSRGCSGPVCTGGLSGSTLGWLAVALTAAVVGGIAAASRALGPAGMSPSRRSWLGSGPLDRELVVRDPLRAIGLGGAVVGLIGGVLVALAVGAPHLSAVLVATGIVAGAVIGALVVLGAALVQGTPLAQAWSVGAWIVLVVGIVGACVTVGPWSLPRLPTLPATWSLGVLAVTVVFAVLGRLALTPRLRQVPYAELRRAGDTAEATLTSILMLETGAVDELRRARARSTRGRYASRPLRGRREWAAVSADLRRLLRARSPLVVAVLLLPVPILVGGVLGPIAATLVAALGSIHIGNAAATGLRLWTRSSSIRRMFPWGPVRVRVVHLLVPVVLAGLWLAAVCAVTGLGLSGWGVLTLVVPGALLRTAPEPSVGVAVAETPLMTSPMGAIPTGLVAVLSRGPDVAAVPLLLLFAGAPLAGGLVALAILLHLCRKD